jgi:regulatory protein
VKTQPSLRERALRLLARREHGRAELAAKLQPYVLPGDDLEALLDEFSRRKQLSDERYAESRVHVLSRKFGAARITHELRSKGIDKSLAEQASRVARASEIERAREIWRRKFQAAPRTDLERAKQMRFLQSRGFSFETIRAVVGRADDN